MRRLRRHRVQLRGRETNAGGRRSLAVQVGEALISASIAAQIGADDEVPPVVVQPLVENGVPA